MGEPAAGDEPVAASSEAAAEAPAEVSPGPPSTRLRSTACPFVLPPPRNGDAASAAAEAAEAAPSSQESDGGSRSPGPGFLVRDPRRTVFVGGLPPTAEPDSLRFYFSAFGRVQHVRVRARIAAQPALPQPPPHAAAADPRPLHRLLQALRLRVVRKRGLGRRRARHALPQLPRRAGPAARRPPPAHPPTRAQASSLTSARRAPRRARRRRTPLLLRSCAWPPPYPPPPASSSATCRARRPRRCWSPSSPCSGRWRR